ncbi:MAG: spore coat protein U domain-containing protein [Candidatus Deferrimicrobiaceae bacterium]
MRKSLTVFIAVAVLAAGGAAWAADTNTLTVSASVAGTCKFSAPKTSALNFTLDPSVGTDVSGSTTTTFWCTKGVTTDAITNNNGLHFNAGKNQMAATVGTDVIPYTLSLTPDGLTNGGPTVTRTLTIAGSVLGADYTSKSAGSYADTVVLTINN